MALERGRRAVVGTIDAGGVYTSLAAAGGGYVFIAGTAMDETGRVPAVATAAPPYEGSEVASAHLQTRYLFQRLRELLPRLGSSIDEVCQLEQYVKLKVHADPYFAVATEPEHLGRARPGGATAQLLGFFPSEAVVSVTGIALAPDPTAGPVKTYPGQESAEPAPGRLFSEAVGAGPYLCSTAFANDRKDGIPRSVRVDELTWRGSEIANEATFAIEQLRKKLAVIGATLADIVSYTVFLTDVNDLYEFDLTFRAAIGMPAPSRAVVPALGYALPRREGAFGHAENAPRMEIQVRTLRPGTGALKVAVEGPGDAYGYQSAAVRVDPLLWLSSVYADASARSEGVTGEIANVLGKIDLTCRNGGTDLGRLLRLRALVTRPEDAFAVYAAVRNAIPSEPPAVSIVVVPALPVRGCTVALDAVAFVGR